MLITYYLEILSPSLTVDGHCKFNFINPHHRSTLIESVHSYSQYNFFIWVESRFVRLYLNLCALISKILTHCGTFIFILYLPGNRRLYICTCVP